jgi:ribosomal protein L37AE/L43A
MSKKPDYLTLCSIAAQKAGTSYGKYMAMHGYHPPIQADVEDVESPQGISKICPQCGKEFTQGKIMQKIYCSLECQKAHAQRAAKRRYRDRKAAAANDTGISTTITCLVEG